MKMNKIKRQLEELIELIASDYFEDMKDNYLDNKDSERFDADDLFYHHKVIPETMGDICQDVCEYTKNKHLINEVTNLENVDVYQTLFWNKYNSKVEEFLLNQKGYDGKFKTMEYFGFNSKDIEQDFKSYLEEQDIDTEITPFQYQVQGYLAYNAYDIRDDSNINVEDYSIVEDLIVGHLHNKFYDWEKEQEIYFKTPEGIKAKAEWDEFEDERYREMETFKKIYGYYPDDEDVAYDIQICEEEIRLRKLHEGLTEEQGKKLLKEMINEVVAEAKTKYKEKEEVEMER